MLISLFRIWQNLATNGKRWQIKEEIGRKVKYYPIMHNIFNRNKKI